MKFEDDPVWTLVSESCSLLVVLPMQMQALITKENSGLIALLRDDKFEDLSRMYSLFKRVEGGLTLIRTIMAEHVKTSGKALVQVRW